MAIEHEGAFPSARADLCVRIHRGDHRERESEVADRIDTIRERQVCDLRQRTGLCELERDRVARPFEATDRPWQPQAPRVKAQTDWGAPPTGHQVDLGHARAAAAQVEPVSPRASIPPGCRRPLGPDGAVPVSLAG